MTIVRHALRIALYVFFAACNGDNGNTNDGGPDGTVSDARMDGDGFDGNCWDDMGDARCYTCPNGPNFLISWNETCGGDPALGFILQWGLEGGTYPFSVDAGDPCDASLCVGSDGSAEQYCSYTLGGLEAGLWCIQAEAYDDAGNVSAPSNLFCGALPGHCP
jgi:hypothetical protein